MSNTIPLPQPQRQLDIDHDHEIRVDLDREAQIDAFIATLSESDLRRVLAILEYGEHKCHGARIACCGGFRCEPCHITHLRSRHGERSVLFWNKLCQESSITWSTTKVSSPPVPKKSNGRHSTRKKRERLTSVNDPSRYQPITIEDKINQALDFLDKMNSAIAARKETTNS